MPAYDPRKLAQSHRPIDPPQRDDLPVPAGLTAHLLLGWLLLSMLCCQSLAAAPLDSLRLASGFDMQVQRFDARGETLLLWLPSKYGIREGHQQFATQVQQQGIDLWLVDLHASYLAPTGRYAFDEFDPTDIEELIGYAVKQGWSSIIVGGESRGAGLAMQAARQWQLRNPRQRVVKGLLFYHPYLIDGLPPLGEVAQFRDIARETNLPMYIFQPQLNTKFLYSRTLLEQLQQGGSTVYFHTLHGVRGGYYLRDSDLLLEAEVEERDRVGQRLRIAIERLIEQPTPPTAAPGIAAASPATERSTDHDGSLAELAARPAPPLRLTDAQGRLIDLVARRGEVVLVNYWASWCGPCVSEIASIQRLSAHFDGQPFRVVAVNIGETREQIDDFFAMRDMAPDFDLLFDSDSSTARDWHVYAIPSSFLLDRSGMIRYGYRGALKWDNPSVIATIEELIAEPRLDVAQ